MALPKAYDARSAHIFRTETTMSETELPPLPPIALGRYRHYKGGEYEVMGVARHSETLEALVIYRPLYNSTGWWARPYVMFMEEVEFAGTRQPRFAPI
jgi:hypothetical protein